MSSSLGRCRVIGLATTSASAFGVTSWRPAVSRIGAGFGDRPRSSGPLPLLSRRPVLAGLAASLIVRALPAFAHEGPGPVKPPVEVPDIGIVSSDGFQGSLRERLLGRATALQLMFARCRSICPIDAATFVRTQEALAPNPSDGIQLISLSIDPANDTPDVLRAWLRSFDAGSGWIAVAPVQADLARAKRFFDSASDLGEDHSTAMSLINHAGLLVWRTPELPAPGEVAALLKRLQQAA